MRRRTKVPPNFVGGVDDTLLGSIRIPERIRDAALGADHGEFDVFHHVFWNDPASTYPAVAIGCQSGVRSPEGTVLAAGDNRRTAEFSLRQAARLVRLVLARIEAGKAGLHNPIPGKRDTLVGVIHPEIEHIVLVGRNVIPASHHALEDFHPEGFGLLRRAHGADLRHEPLVVGRTDNLEAEAPFLLVAATHGLRGERRGQPNHQREGSEKRTQHVQSFHLQSSLQIIVTPSGVGRGGVGTRGGEGFLTFATCLWRCHTTSRGWLQRPPQVASSSVNGTIYISPSTSST